MVKPSRCFATSCRANEYNRDDCKLNSCDAEGPVDARTKRLIADWLGLSLNGWKVESYINSGKSAHVFRGSKGSLQAAIKIFDPEIIEKFGEASERERINRELTLIGVEHENLVKIFDGGHSAEHDLFFVVMEFLDAPNLGTVLTEVPIQQVPSLISQLASAAKFLDGLKIVHRDIKPDNIAISPDFQKLTLLDLGVIRPYGPGAADPITDKEKKLFVGTLQYSSPEYLLRQESSGEEGALALTYYQLGAVLHDLLMKKRIFAEDTDPFARLVNAVLYESPQIDAVGKPVHLVTLARNCLVKKPDLRLSLVSWGAFDPPTEGDIVAIAKERIRKRKIQATYELSPDESEADSGPQRRGAALLSTLLPRLAEGIREECTEGQLPPRSVQDYSDDRASSGLVDIRFNAAPRAGLLAAISFRVLLKVVDSEAQIVSIHFMSLSGNAEDQPQVADAGPAIFSGLFDGLAVREAIAKVLYPAMAEAMEVPTQVLPPDDLPNKNDGAI
jgi:serine/threonine protein kinase